MNTELSALNDFPKKVVSIRERLGCQDCPLMQEYPYGETFEPECTANSTINVPPAGTPPECPLRRTDIIITLDTGR